MNVRNVMLKLFCFDFGNILCVSVFIINNFWRYICKFVIKSDFYNLVLVIFFNRNIEYILMLFF